MKRALIRYRTKPERGDENARLIERVFAELRAASPQGLRYLVLRLADGGFMHLVTAETEDGSSALTSLPAFKAFRAGIAERCAEAPQTSEATIVGDYHMLGA